MTPGAAKSLTRSVPQTVDDFINAGCAVQRFWLMATRLGLVMQPEMTPPIFGGYARAGTPVLQVERLDHEARTLLANAAGTGGRLGLTACRLDGTHRCWGADNVTVDPFAAGTPDRPGSAVARGIVSDDNRIRSGMSVEQYPHASVVGHVKRGFSLPDPLACLWPDVHQ